MDNNQDDYSERFYEYLKDYPFILFYHGPYQDNPGYNIVEIVEYNLSLYYPLKLTRRLVYLVIESIQNIERYSSHTDESNDFSLIYSDNDSFNIVTQNVIQNDQVDALKERLDSISDHHVDTLTDLYMEVLQSGERTEHGAGLGLIDLARKSNNNLSYQIERIDENTSYYRLHISYPITQGAQRDDAEKLVSVFNERFKGNSSTLFYSGDFSNRFLTVMLNMLNQIKDWVDESVKSQFQHTVIELIQNIKNHGKSIGAIIPGSVLVQWKQSELYLETANLIESDCQEPLIKRITELNDASIDELELMSRKALLSKDNKGLGLTHAARFTRPQKLNHNFVTVNDLGLVFRICTKFKS